MPTCSALFCLVHRRSIASKKDTHLTTQIAVITIVLWLKRIVYCLSLWYNKTVKMLGKSMFSIWYEKRPLWAGRHTKLDRVFGYEPKGQGFESLTPYQKSRYPTGYRDFCYVR